MKTARLRADQKALTRVRILTTAKRLFDLRGYQGVTLKQIVEDIGMTTGAFPAHFKNKADLWQACYDKIYVSEPDQINALKDQLAKAQARIFDMLLGDDGQAFSEAERYLRAARPDLAALVDKHDGRKAR